MAFRFLLALFLALCFMPLAQAATPSSDPKLAACLKRAEELPDFTAAEAEGWMKRGGGDAARLCRATAQFHRGEYANAAREYVTLAATHDKKDRKEVASLHARAALAFTRASDSKNAEAEYAAALRLEPQNPDILVDRAMARAEIERFWDAIDDLNKALKSAPENISALRARGHAWLKLGQESKAKRDFEKVEALENPEGQNKQ